MMGILSFKILHWAKFARWQKFLGQKFLGQKFLGQKFLTVMAIIFCLHPNSVATAGVIEQDRIKLLPQIYLNIWQIGQINNNIAQGNLVKFDKNQFSFLEESIGNISFESFQPAVLDTKAKPQVRRDDPLSLNMLDTNLFLDAMSDSETLRTIYFNSQQLRFNFRLSLMGLIGDDLIKEELAENRRREAGGGNILDHTPIPDTNSSKEFGGQRSLNKFLANLNSFIFVILALCFVILLFMRFFGKRI